VIWMSCWLMALSPVMWHCRRSVPQSAGAAPQASSRWGAPRPLAGLAHLTA
jgi:hypothetical protein